LGREFGVMVRLQRLDMTDRDKRGFAKEMDYARSPARIDLRLITGTRNQLKILQ
jgi:hypothetical protein